jgi:hypothetical protein
MAFQTRADHQNQAIGWLLKGGTISLNLGFIWEMSVKLFCGARYKTRFGELAQIRIFICILCINILVFITLLHPKLFNPYVYEENGLIENITAVLALLSVILSFFCSFKKTNEYKTLSIFICIISLILFLDEISFIWTILNIESEDTRIVIGENEVWIDSLHDLMDVAILYTHQFVAFSMIAATVAVFTLISAYKRASVIRARVFRSIFSDTPYFYFMFFIFFAIFAVVIDQLGWLNHLWGLNISEKTRESIKPIEEMSEMNASLSLVFGVLRMMK